MDCLLALSTLRVPGKDSACSDGWRGVVVVGGLHSAHLDLLRLASAAAACRSWVDLLTGTPNTAL